MYAIFVDLTKAFNTVSRRGLWMVLRQIGCPEKFVKIIQSFHDGMQGQFIDAPLIRALLDYVARYKFMYVCM